MESISSIELVRLKFHPMLLYSNSSHGVWSLTKTGHPLFQSLANQGIPVELQQGSDLGERMHNALEAALLHGEFALLIGTDCPALTVDYLDRACRALLDGADVVLGPAEDGGYVLIGLRHCHRELFTDIPWSTDRVLDITRERLATQGCRAVELDTLWDLDRPEDLLRWRRGSAPTQTA